MKGPRARIWWDNLVIDVRYQMRAMAKSPGFVTLAVCSFGMAIAVNTAVFSITKAVLLDSLNVQHPERLRVLRWEFPGSQPMNSLRGDLERTRSGGTTSTSFSYPVYEALKQSDAFEEFTAFEPDPRLLAVTINRQTDLASAQLVAGNFFATLGAVAAEGRPLLPSDDRPGATGVVVISDSYWAQQFGRSPGVIGNEIVVNQVSMTVVGVMPPRFSGSRLGKPPEMFIPLAQQPIVSPRIVDGVNRNEFADGERWWLAILGRIKPDVGESKARASLEEIFAQAVTTTLPDRQHRGLDRLRILVGPGNRGVEESNDKLSETVNVLEGAVALLLLLGCANVANLLLARSASRRRELCIRVALGAQRSRMLRSAFLESVLLALLGGAVGLLLAYLARNLIPDILDLKLPVYFDWGVMAFTFAISLLCGLLFGIVPALQTTRSDCESGLKDTARATTDRGRVVLGKSLVAFQVCLSVVILSGAGLFIRTLHNLTHAELGFRPEDLLLLDVSLPKNQYKTDASRTRVFSDLRAQINVIPGVTGSTFSTAALIAGETSSSNFNPNGDRLQHESAWVNVVGSNYFETMGIPILAGRSFENGDSESSPKVAVVNSRLAREFFPNQDPIGRTFNDERITIIGICGNARFKNLRSDPPPTYYLYYPQAAESNSITFEVRTAVFPSSLTASVRSLMRALDNSVPITNVRTQNEQIEESLRQEKLFAALASGFGVFSVLLASVGVYGIMAYVVSQRRNQIGIRMALGAETAQVLRAVLLEACWLVAAGIILGFVIALVVGRLVAGSLYGVRSGDPTVLGAAAALLFAIAVIAAWGPARRAAQVDPIEALRDQ